MVKAERETNRNLSPTYRSGNIFRIMYYYKPDSRLVIFLQSGVTPAQTSF